VTFRTARVMSKLPASHRTLWFDGIRGGRALFVVLYHIWSMNWPSFPSNSGSSWLGWLLYGHMAVAISSSSRV
jgi:hypothetical protein